VTGTDPAARTIAITDDRHEGLTPMKKILPTILLGLLLALSAGPARADEPAWQDSLLDRFAGRWVLSGEIAGQETTHDVSAEWVLARQYLEVHEVSRERDAHGQPAYEAIVFVGQDPAADGYACLWLDVTGGGGLSARVIGHARRGGDEIPFVFAIPDGSTFHTTFAYERSTDTWRWRMDAGQKGESQPFARLRMTRAPVRPDGGAQP
jgi:hypothetical protein